MNEYYADLVRVARHRGLTLEDAEEVAQDAILLLFRKAASREVELVAEDTLRNRAGQLRSPRAWLRDVVGLLVRNRIRRRIRRHESSLPLDDAGTAVAAETTEREMELLGFGACVFGLLDPQESELLRLDLLGYRSHEIAEFLGVPASTVRVRKKRLLDRLRGDPELQERAASLGCGRDDEPTFENDDDEPPSPGDGPRQGGAMKRTRPTRIGTRQSKQPVAQRRAGTLSRARLEALLAEYGAACRRRGLDPRPSPPRSAAAEPHRSATRTAGPDDGPTRNPRLRTPWVQGILAWGAPSLALAVAVVALAVLAPDALRLIGTGPAAPFGGMSRGVETGRAKPTPSGISLASRRDQGEPSRTRFPSTTEFVRVAGSWTREGQPLGADLVPTHAEASRRSIRMPSSGPNPSRCLRGTAGGGLLAADATELQRL